jgi:hypothetical protein
LNLEKHGAVDQVMRPAPPEGVDGLAPCRTGSRFCTPEARGFRASGRGSRSSGAHTKARSLVLRVPCLNAPRREAPAWRQHRWCGCFSR